MISLLQLTCSPNCNSRVSLLQLTCSPNCNSRVMPNCNSRVGSHVSCSLSLDIQQGYKSFRCDFAGLKMRTHYAASLRRCAARGSSGWVVYFNNEDKTRTPTGARS